MPFGQLEESWQQHASQEGASSECGNATLAGSSLRLVMN
jgi:hypothetical protein